LELPRNTLHRILLRHDLVREEKRRTPATQRFERREPNELWQMDFKGPKGWPHPVGPLSVLDDHSRYLIALADNGSTHGAPVREQLEEAFPAPRILQRLRRQIHCPGHLIPHHERRSPALPAQPRQAPFPIHPESPFPFRNRLP
jgi:hypothetical protein